MSRIKLPVQERFILKAACLAEADRLIAGGLISGMSRSEIAREIYFHAMIHRLCARTGWFPGLKAHADSIEMDDGGDTLLRRIAYRLAWMLPGKG